MRSGKGAVMGLGLMGASPIILMSSGWNKPLCEGFLFWCIVSRRPLGKNERGLLGNLQLSRATARRLHRSPGQSNLRRWGRYRQKEVSQAEWSSQDQRGCVLVVLSARYHRYPVFPPPWQVCQGLCGNISHKNLGDSASAK